MVRETALTLRPGAAYNASVSGESRIIERLLTAEEIEALTNEHFGDMFKYVVDVKRGRLAAGGEFHADAEQALVESGSAQADVWGANYFCARPAGSRIEYVAMINIRPSAGNRGMDIQSQDVRAQVRAATERLIGPA